LRLARQVRQWAGRFVALNPRAHALSVLVRYSQLSLTERLGHLDLKTVEALQAEVGAAGLTPAKLDAMQWRKSGMSAGPAGRSGSSYIVV
jgi:hypothetical protein